MVRRTEFKMSVNRFGILLVSVGDTIGDNIFKSALVEIIKKTHKMSKSTARSR